MWPISIFSRSMMQNLSEISDTHVEHFQMKHTTTRMEQTGTAVWRARGASYVNVFRQRTLVSGADSESVGFIFFDQLPHASVGPK